MGKKSMCNMDCLNCKFEDCVNPNPIKFGEYDEKVATEQNKTPSKELIYQRARTAKRKSKGLCISCGKPTADGKLLCEACLISYAEKRKICYDNRISEKRCYCGKPLAEGKTRCQDCLDKNALNVMKRRNRLLENHICIVCGKETPLEGQIRCESCRKRGSKRTTDRTLERQKLRQEQNMCMTCGKIMGEEDKNYKNCAECREKKNNYKKERTERLKNGM